MASDEDKTPPHHPTYNVKLTHQQVEDIVQSVFKDGRVVRAEELPRGQSFNNRIYFITVESHHPDQQSLPEQYVLKLCGHYFGSTKVQNELCAIELVRKFCPSVPIAETVAWSFDGRACFSRDVDGRLAQAMLSGKSDRPWILQRRLRGRMLTIGDLDGKFGQHILHRLAQHLAAWRTQIPDQTRIGNMMLEAHPRSNIPAEDSVLYTAQGEVQINGLLLNHRPNTPVLSTWAGYYENQLRDQYDHLIGTPALSQLAESIQLSVAKFLPELKHLPFLKSKSIKFSHMDFSPRNTLISESADASEAPEITGILDLEFAAFLPAPSEFLNSIVNQADDWPVRHYQTLLVELRQLERIEKRNDAGLTVEVPMVDPPQESCQNPESCLCGYHTFQALATLQAVIAAVAPWWISSTSHIDKEAELKAACEASTETVIAGIERLRSYL
jgi:hypothetical protein